MEILYVSSGQDQTYFFFFLNKYFILFFFIIYLSFRSPFQTDFLVLRIR